MSRWAALMLFDDTQTYDSLLAWAREHRTHVCVSLNEEFANQLASELSEFAIDPDAPPLVFTLNMDLTVRG